MFLRRLTRVVLHDGHLHPHRDFAAELLARQRLVALDGTFAHPRRHETTIGVFAREAVTVVSYPGVHNHGARLLQRVRHPTWRP